jgi:uncharacterized OsmC-like protein
MRLREMDVISFARKEHQQVTQLEVRINALRSRDHLKLLISSLISYLVSGENVGEAVILCLIELSTAKYFPLLFMLAQAFQMELHYEIYEVGCNSVRRLTSQGIWQERNA